MIGGERTCSIKSSGLQSKSHTSLGLVVLHTNPNLDKGRQKQLPQSRQITCPIKGKEIIQIKGTELHQIHVVSSRIYKWPRHLLTKHSHLGLVVHGGDALNTNP